MMIQPSQVDQGPNNIGRGIACRTVMIWMIFLKVSTNDLGIAVGDLPSRIYLYPMIAFAPCQGLMSIPSGVLDAGYVYYLKI